ncbi:MAG: hypothetical protein KIT35_04730 [Piscinibacter sp.]|uniref:hypothetical protein n=1 Tax=Piscinibacter TaxID=1114981 RepID=UPI000FDEC261|nr:MULTISPECIES: hypothetical protein [Piscinibacter]MCW5663118.1 hypothetical protein [Piscinibacter sp.]
MTTARLEALVWVLIYGGLILVALGLAVQRRDDLLGWSLVGLGSVVALAGAVLVVVRARRPEDKP